MRKCFALLLVISSAVTFGQDRFFARTYTTNVLPKGNIDFELWHTSRFGHAGQYFHGQDQRMEIEFGLGHNLQTAFYFNKYQDRVSTGASGTTAESQMGFSNEWKWKLSDPSINTLGVALYGEAGVKGGDEIEVESKVIIDKRLGSHLLAFNGVVEWDREFSWNNNKTSSLTAATPVEFDLAYMFNYSSKLGLGIELRDFNGINKSKGWQYSVLSAGPTVNYRTGRWFVIANYLPQLINMRKTSYQPGNKVLDDMEKVEARILIGISL